MKKMWRVIFAIFLILILIGIVAVAVGFLTGADTARIYQTAEDNATIKQMIAYFNWFVEVVQTYWNAFFGAYFR